jgi:hypothetical protein
MLNDPMRQSSRRRRRRSFHNPARLAKEDFAARKQCRRYLRIQERAGMPLPPTSQHNRLTKHVSEPDARSGDGFQNRTC